MASTYSTNLAIELIGTGDQAGTWGVTTNTNLGTLIEQAISGYVTQAVATGTDTTITIPNGATGVARNMYIELTGTGGTNTNLIVPSNKKLYFIFNNSTGAVTVKVTGQTGVSVPQGKKMLLVCNGTDIVNGVNYIADFGTNSFTVTNLTASSGTITNLIATTASVSDLSATVTRSASGTITNLIATTASVSDLSATVTRSASGTITNLIATTASISDASATVLRAGSATLTHLSATSASITNLALTSLTISSLSITNVSVASATVSSNLTLSGGTANGVLYLDGSKVATSGSALTFDGTILSNIQTNTTEYQPTSTGASNPAGLSLLLQNLDTTTNNTIAGLQLAARGASSTSASLWYIANAGGTTNQTGTLVFGNRTGSTSYAERMRIDSAGNLGIGTASPIYKLHVENNAASTTNIAVLNTSASSGAYAQVRVQGDSGIGYFGYAGSGNAAGGLYDADCVYLASESTAAALCIGTSGGSAPIRFFTNGSSAASERMRVTSDGRLLIGQTSAFAAGGLTSYAQIVGTGQETSSELLVRLSATNQSPSIVFGKANGAAATDAVASGTQLGRIFFAGSDGTDMNSIGASIESFVDGTVATDNMPGRLVFSTTGATAATPTERMRITSAGNVGIGTTSPNIGSLTGTVLTLNGSAQSNLEMASAGASRARIASSSSDTTFETRVSSPLVFGTNSTERMRLDTSGNLGIGTASPGAKLQVVSSSDYSVSSSGRAINGLDIAGSAGGSGNFAAGISFGVGGVGRAAIAGVQNSSDSDVVGLAFFTHGSGTGSADASESMRITSAGNVGIGTTSPGNFSALTLGDSILDVNGVIQVRGDATNGIAIFQLGGDTYRKANIFSPVGTDTPYLAFGVASSGSSSSTTERMRITDAGDVGIGTTTPITKLNVVGDITVQPAASDTDGGALNFYNTDSSINTSQALGRILFSDRDATGGLQTTFAYIYGVASGTHAAGDNPTDIVFGTTPNNTETVAEAGRITESGSYVLKGGNTAPGGVGIAFPATQVASADANSLDDYEEGAWTPTLVGSTTAGDYTVTGSYCSYTKIGRLVTVTGILSITVNSAGTGAATFGGLPFSKGANQWFVGNTILKGVDVEANTISLALAPNVASASASFRIVSVKDDANPVENLITGITTGDTVDVSIQYYV